MSNIILCADDSKTVQTVAEITFRVSDFEYIGAYNAEDALNKARESKPALILADAIMPGKTGYDLCQMVKGDPALADVPVVVLCGNSSPYDSGKGSQVGADGHLTKPWDTQVMLDKVAELLEKLGGGVARPAAAATKPAAARPATPPPTAVKPPTPVSPTSRPTPPAVRVPTPKPPPVVPKPPILPGQPATAKPPARPPVPDVDARTNTIMGMPSGLPPALMTKGRGAPDGLGGKPGAPVTPPPVKPAISKPIPPPPGLGPAGTTSKPGGLGPAGNVSRPAPPSSNKYAAPSKKAVITQPGVPEGPKPAPPRATPRSIEVPPAPDVGLGPSGNVNAASAAAEDRRPSSAPGVGLGPSGNVGIDRPPMIRGIATRRPSAARPATPAPQAAAPAARAPLAANVAVATSAAASDVAREAGLDPNGPEMRALLALSKDVVERVVWEVVPDLAEQIIRENLDQLTKR